MEYIALHLVISPLEPFTDVITYHLSEEGFEMFEDRPEGLTAFIPADLFNEKTVSEVISQVSELGCEIKMHVETIAPKNWNEEWENNFQPQVIADQVYIRADFHSSDPSYKYEIVVQPKMAFGTGHHATTAQCMEQMLLLDFQNKSVLDMGCGTGILAILASMLGANPICAIDIDPVCVESSSENSIRNNCVAIEVLQGIAEDIKDRKFNIVLANINRNIILSDLSFYSEMLTSNGTIIMSGFYLQDLTVIRQKAESLHLVYRQHIHKNDWCCAVFNKE